MPNCVLRVARNLYVKGNLQAGCVKREGFPGRNVTLVWSPSICQPLLRWENVAGITIQPTLERACSSASRLFGGVRDGEDDCDGETDALIEGKGIIDGGVDIETEGEIEGEGNQGTDGNIDGDIDGCVEGERENEGYGGRGGGDSCGGGDNDIGKDDGDDIVIGAGVGA